MQEATLDLNARKALVLGANHPAAAAVALALAKAGADVAVTSATGDPEEAFGLRPLRRAIEAEGRRAIADIADLGNGASVQIAVRQIAKQLGRIDLAVIASGAAAPGPAERMTDAEWSKAIALNLGAYFYACRALAREFAGNPAVEGVKGRIVALLQPGDGSVVELAGCAGARALVGALAREWAGRGIVVNGVSVEPGASEMDVVEATLRLAVAGADTTGMVAEVAVR